MSGRLILFGGSIILLTMAFHIVGLVLLAAAIQRLNANPRFASTIVKSIITLSVAVYGVLLLHIIEALAWAQLYVLVGEFDEISRALYFSIVTLTTLGYGDIVLSETWQLLSTFEAIGGLVLFGTTTAFLIGVTSHFFRRFD